MIGGADRTSGIAIWAHNRTRVVIPAGIGTNAGENRPGLGREMKKYIRRTDGKMFLIRMCPNCHSKPKIRNYYGPYTSGKYIQCPKCGISTFVEPIEDAVKEWNARENLGLRVVKKRGILAFIKKE